MKLILETSGSDSIGDVAKTAYRMSLLLNVTIEFRYDGITFWANEHWDTERICKRYVEEVQKPENWSAA